MLEIFCDGAIKGYKEQRNLPDRTGTSKLSPHLHFGEISPQQIWRQVQRLRVNEAEREDVRHFGSELGWREFSYHLLHHFPHSSEQSLNPRFADFDWAKTDPAALARWQRGQTGIPIVDAGMRELWQTGWMHNRVRMIVASFLCKNLRYHWLEGARWFWDTLAGRRSGQQQPRLAMDGRHRLRCRAVFPHIQSGHPIRTFRSESRLHQTLGAGTGWSAGAAGFFAVAETIHMPSAGSGLPLRSLVDLAESRSRALAAYSGK